MDLHFFCSYYDKINLTIDIGRDSNIPLSGNSYLYRHAFCWCGILLNMLKENVIDSHLIQRMLSIRNMARVVYY